MGVGKIEEDQADFVGDGGFGEKRFDRGRNYRSGLFTRIAVGSGGDRRESDRAQMVFRGESERIAVAGSEQSRIGCAAANDRADSVDYIFGGKISSRGDNRLTGRQTLRKAGLAQLAALFEDARAAAAMDGPVHPASAEQGVIGGVDDGVYLLRGDVAHQDVDATI